MAKLSALVVLALLAVCSVAKAQEDADQISCRVHVVNNTASPDSNMLGHVRSSLKVLSAADIADVSVIVQVQHPDVAALEVTLTAAGNTQTSSSVTLKSPAAGPGGANMIQTIFSDYAPNAFPTTGAEAPFSSVYRPAQPLGGLVSGASTAAGAGGSQGVWTLTVTDTAATKRPLKLTGWELWLCGASNGPLFASDMNATAFDGSEVVPELSIVRKRVAVPSKRDIASVLKSAKRSALASEDPAAEVIDQVNEFIAKQLARSFEPAQALLDRVSPALSKVLEGNIASSIHTLKKLPGVMGFKEVGDRFDLPTSEDEIKDFLDTLVHCYNDLYWCWQQTGLDGNFAQDFVATWESRSKPVAKTWAAVQDQWLNSIANFEESNPSLAPWGDALFYSTIGTLYRAAQLDAVATVAEAWADTAIRLALYISPVRFAVNPRTFIVQSLSAAASVLRTLFATFNEIEQLSDGDNNNDIPAITAFVEGLVLATRQMTELVTLGLRTRVEGMQRTITASAGGMANTAASLNERVADTLGALDPRLGAIYNASTDSINEALRDIATSQQDAVARYFRASNNMMNLGGELERTFNLAGDAVVAMSTNIATAMKSAQNQLDEMTPGPNMQQVIVQLRKTVEGILSDTRDTLSRNVPVPEIREMEDLLTATVQVQLDLLDQAATVVNDGPGAQAITAQMTRMASNLLDASSGVSRVMESISEGFPGPMLNSTLAGIRQQSARTATNLERMFSELARDYPNLDPATFVKELGSTLNGLTVSTLDLTTAFENLAGFDAARALGQALPDAMEPVLSTVTAAAASLPALVGGTAGRDPERLSTLQADIGKALESFAGQVKTIAESMPNEPPVPAISERLTQRSSELSRDTNRLRQQIVGAVGVPASQLEAGVAGLNKRLEGFVKDLRGQSAQAARLGKQLAKGPLAEVAASLSPLLTLVTEGTQTMAGNLPPLDEVRGLVNETLAPAADAFGASLRQATRAAIDTTANVNRQGLQVMATGLEAVISGVNAAQLQIATMLNAAGRVGEQLLAATPALERNVPGSLAALDTTLATTVDGITKGLQANLGGLAPPEEIVRGLVEPLAKQLNRGLNGVLSGAELVAENSLPNLQNVMDGASGVVRDLAGQAASALGLTNPTGLAPRITGRHLMQLSSVTIPTGFDAVGFNGAIQDALMGAASQYVNAAVAAVNGRPGLSAALGGIMQYIETLTGVSTQLDGFLSALPQGRVMSVILDVVGGKSVIDSLASLQGALKTAAPGEQGAVVEQIATVLGSLSGGGAVSARPAVQAALQAASKQLLPNAQELLSGFRSELAAAMAAGN